MGSAQVPCEALNLHTEEGRWMTLGESAVREAGKFFAWSPCRCGKVEQRLRWLHYITVIAMIRTTMTTMNLVRTIKNTMRILLDDDDDDDGLGRR